MYILSSLVLIMLFSYTECWTFSDLFWFILHYLNDFHFHHLVLIHLRRISWWEEHYFLFPSCYLLYSYTPLAPIVKYSEKTAQKTLYFWIWIISIKGLFIIQSWKIWSWKMYGSILLITLFSSRLRVNNLWITELPGNIKSLDDTTPFKSKSSKLLEAYLTLTYIKLRNPSTKHQATLLLMVVCAIWKQIYQWCKNKGQISPLLLRKVSDSVEVFTSQFQV